MRPCHEHWQAGDSHHVCGRDTEHESWHLCVCGAVLMTNRPSGHHPARDIGCPECLAGVGRPCHTTLGATMRGVHASRAEAFERMVSDG